MTDEYSQWQPTGMDEGGWNPPEPAPREPAVEAPAEPGGEGAPAGAAASKPARARSQAPTLAQTRRILDARRLLDDPDVKRLVADVAGDDEARQVFAIIEGRAGRGVGVLVDAAGEKGEARRTVMLMMLAEREPAALRAAAQAANALDPSLSLKVRGSQTDLAVALALAAPTLDLERVRGLAD